MRNGNPDYMAGKLENARHEIKKLASDIEMFAANQMLGKMAYRIFNQGGATYGKIGKYKSGSRKNRKSTIAALKKSGGKRSGIARRRDLSPYEMKRLKKGRQIAYKDLQFSGGLFESLRVGKRNGKYMLGIVGKAKNGTRYSDITLYQEDQTGKLIFAPSPSEKQEVKEEIFEYTRMRLNKIFKRALS